MSGGSSTNSSWTLLTPEESVAETLRPLAEGTEHHEENLQAGTGENQPAETAEAFPVEGHLVSEDKTAELSGDTSSAEPVAGTDDPVPTSLEAPGSSDPGSDALSQSEGLPEGPDQSGPGPDSFSDSYTHITPSPDEPSASLLSTETLGGEFTQEATLQPLNGEEPLQEWEGSDLFPRTADIGKQADSLVDSEVVEGRPEKTGEEAESELRRRRSLLAALERIGRTEEEEEGEEEFQLPQRNEDSGFSVNKCILGAVILLGLGTIFFSGVFMDLDEESDYGTMELKDAEVPGKQEWLNPEVPPVPVDADSTELLNNLAKGNQQISALQAQLQAQNEELKVAKGQAAEGAKERLQREEVEKENSRLKKEMASLPVLQKENERMKRELESVPALQKELETLRSTVLKLSSATEAAEVPVKPTTPPPSGQTEEHTQDSRKTWHDQREKRKDVKYDKIDEKEWKGRDKSEWKEGEKHEHKDGGKAEWKKGKHEQGKFDREKDKEGKQKRQGDWNEKERKREKARGDEGKPWKDMEGKKDWLEKSERKERKEEKEWKRAKHEKVKDAQQSRGKEEKKKDWKVGKDHGEKHKEEWKGEKEWKKGKDGFRGSGKEKWEKKDWKEKGEKKEWKKKEDDWKNKDGKDHRKDERKQWEESKNHGDEKKRWNDNERKSKNGKDEKEWRSKDDRKQWEKKEGGGEKDKKRNKDWKNDRSSSLKQKDEHKGPKEEHLWGDQTPPHSHSRPSLDLPEYWDQQRLRLQHNPKPPQQCNSLETCAQAEGLLPVSFPEFQDVLLEYLAKAEEAGVEASKRDELKRLASEFFKDGVFVHDQMSFQEFVEDLTDILEDMVEEDDDEGEDSAIEEEMEGFEMEVMKKFSMPGALEKEERSKGELRKESGRGRD